MNTLLRVFALLMMPLVVPTVLANESQSKITFDQGSVLVICAPPEGVKLTTEQFNKAFPEWITTLQIRANEGVITRAHYLGELKAGIFIVVGGDSAQIAMENASAISDELNAIYRKTTGTDGIETCKFREIGPVAILPQ